MSSTVLLSKGAGQIYIMTVMAEAAVADDSVLPLTLGTLVIEGAYNIQKAKT